MKRSPRKFPLQSKKTKPRRFNDMDEDIEEEIGQPDPDISLRQASRGQ